MNIISLSTWVLLGLPLLLCQTLSIFSNVIVFQVGRKQFCEEFDNRKWSTQIICLDMLYNPQNYSQLTLFHTDAFKCGIMLALSCEEMRDNNWKSQAGGLQNGEREWKRERKQREKKEEATENGPKFCFGSKKQRKLSGVCLM